MIYTLVLKLRNLKKDELISLTSERINCKIILLLI